jgi:hypothetical protein
MDNQNNPINQNPGNNNNVKNNASSSGTNLTISEPEKRAKIAEFKAKYFTVYNDYCDEKINYDTIL